MKQYKFNEEDLERLLGEMQVGKNSYWVDSIILEWAESLEKEELESMNKEKLEDWVKDKSTARLIWECGKMVQDTK